MSRRSSDEGRWKEFLNIACAKYIHEVMFGGQVPARLAEVRPEARVVPAPLQPAQVANNLEVPMFRKLLPRNVHNVERVVRVLAGLGMISLVFVGPQTPWGALGIIPIVTGLVGSCPLSRLCGAGTCAVKDEA